MSRYRGPRLKKIRRLGALPGLTRKTPKSGSNLKKKFNSGKKEQYRMRLQPIHLKTFLQKKPLFPHP